MAQPGCCCRLTQAEINGIRASRCVWRPPSLHEILLIPYDVHLHFALFMYFWKICSRSCSNKHEATQCKTSKYNSDLQTSKWSASYARCSKENAAMEISLSLCMGTLWDHTLCPWELCLFETGEFRERLRAQSAQVNSYSEMPESLDLLSHLASVSFEYAENYRSLNASHSITHTSYQTTTFRNRHDFLTCI